MIDTHHIRTGSNLHSQRLPLKENGFTVLEVLLALFLTGILTAIFGMGLVAAVQSYDFSRNNAHIAQKAQLAMARMSRELMELIDIVAVSGDGDEPHIIYERLVDGNPPAVMRFGIHHHPGDNTIRLYTDLNTGETSLDGSTIDQGDPLIDDVAGLSLEYMQGASDWTLNTADDNIQLLSSVHLTLTLNRPDNPSQTQAFNTIIHLRNNNNFGGTAPTTTPESREDYSCFIDTLSQGASL